MAEALLRMRGIDKRFGHVHANRAIDLEVERGTILGLLGENGSGKSTLMKILFGIVEPDAGQIMFDGQALSGHTPKDVMAAGIGMIHQHFMLVEAMTVAENIMLGWDKATGLGGQVLKRAEAASRIRETSERYGLDLDPDARIADLQLGTRQRVEIVKALLRGAELLILDEPTSNLSPPEVSGLFATLRRIRADGKAVIFISHKLGEVMEICDLVVVLRTGAVSGQARVEETDRSALGRMIVGDDIASALPETTATPSRGRDVLVVDGLCASEAPGTHGIRDVSFAVREGEIFALAGVDGNGQRELAHALAGLIPVSAGSVRLAGESITDWPVARRTAAGLAYIPADRAHTSLVPELTVGENVALRDFDRPIYSRRGVIDRNALDERAKQAIREFRIAAPFSGTTVADLSGGNQQKIVLSRELGRAPVALIAHQPTWGLDPGAARFVLDQLLSLRDQGATIVFISSELEEILAIGDRIGVLFEGALLVDLPRGRVDTSTLGRLMAGDRSARPGAVPAHQGAST